uniref:Aminotransferase class I/II-fold pyridoxal phosphate-dependent enzyme n=1 Tax=Roseihalotalea indica TaxID=2867963 RepID=A0AA49GJ69_9BACT|nr:aminotransferase class I/II-fold pyridoxal phosphate-dependent enzyme [Tunicatimonas sp. TK19036]
MNKDLSLETLLMHFGEDRSAYEGAVVPPMFQNSLFTFESWEAIDEAYEDRTNHFIYSRGKNPTVQIAERKLALLAGAEKAQLFPSGMGAISAAILHCLNAGDHVIAIKNIYGPTNNLLTKYLKQKMGIEVTYVLGDKVEDFEAAIQDRTRLIYLESPSSAVFSLQDLEAVAALARARNIRTIIDNTWATPILQPALSMGIDLEVHSCSKYIGGHSDIIAGVVMGKAVDIDAIATREYEWLGAKTAPFEAWLILRSLRTLPIRLRQHQENGMKVAQFLDAHPKIKLVRYPGLESFPQYALGQKQMKGYTGLMSFQLATEDLDKIKTFVNSLKVFKIGVSWGGHESLIYAPAISYLKELSPEQFGAMGISLGDMRISVGLENVDDLINDMEAALEKI